MEAFSRLESLMSMLRDQQKGCPWDQAQTSLSLREFILEEAYELLGAIEENNPGKIREELGDLLLQVVFIAQIEKEKGSFSLQDVVNGLIEKIIQRHPHVFGDGTVSSAAEVKVNWERIKNRDKSRTSLLSSYPQAMPALLTAQRIASQAAAVGFDWREAEKALEKVEEEIAELKSALQGAGQDELHEEIGDLFFALANVSRLLKINPELALRAANEKFSRRFRYLESELVKKGLKIETVPLDRLEELWIEAKEQGL